MAPSDAPILKLKRTAQRISRIIHITPQQTKKSFIFRTISYKTLHGRTIHQQIQIMPSTHLKMMKNKLMAMVAVKHYLVRIIHVVEDHKVVHRVYQIMAKIT